MIPLYHTPVSYQDLFHCEEPWRHSTEADQAKVRRRKGTGQGERGKKRDWRERKGGRGGKKREWRERKGGEEKRKEVKRNEGRREERHSTRESMCWQAGDQWPELLGLKFRVVTIHHSPTFRTPQSSNCEES